MAAAPGEEGEEGAYEKAVHTLLAQGNALLVKKKEDPANFDALIALAHINPSMYPSSTRNSKVKICCAGRAGGACMQKV